ncbi:MAG: phosphoesterase, partial [Lachnospiraceae bacterium]|nr:phosphoesterase [Lachnospiraceae bacterium]
MKAIQNFFIKYRHAWVFLYGLIYLPWFGWLEKHVTSDFHVIHMAIDDSIPFIEYFVIPYFLWFAYIAVSITYFFFQDKKDFYKLCIFLFTGMTIFLIVSTIYPNGHHLRPEQFYHENIFTKMT